MRVCSVSGCPTVYPRDEGSRCPAHRRAADKGRGTATDRGYTSKGHRSFRNQTLARDPICICGIREATVADHYPRTRRELVALGLDPNDPAYGRGLCASCHNKWTAIDSPGGWNDRQT